MSSETVPQTLVILGAPPGVPGVPPGGYPHGLDVKRVEQDAAWTDPLPSLVVAWPSGGAWVTAALDALRATRGGAQVPVVAVLPAVDAALVKRLRDLGVRRVLLADELEMNWPSVARAAALRAHGTQGGAA